MSEYIENKVANSGLITISLEEFHQKGDRVLFDIKPLLWQELALKEKDFRSFIKQHDWRQYQDNFVAITCSADAIVPTLGIYASRYSSSALCEKSNFWKSF